MYKIQSYKTAGRSTKPIKRSILIKCEIQEHYGAQSFDRFTSNHYIVIVTHNRADIRYPHYTNERIYRLNQDEYEKFINNRLKRGASMEFRLFGKPKENAICFFIDLPANYISEEQDTSYSLLLRRLDKFRLVMIK